MASDRQQFRRASRQWEQLHETHAYSLPIEDGFTAVLVAAEIDEKTLADGDFSPDEICHITDEQAKFYEEAEAIKQQISSDGGRAIVLDAAAGEVFDSVIADPDIASIITIGHGDLSGVNITTSDNGFREYDWRDVLSSVTHLKQGFFIQRHCGMPNRNLSVPLGLFCMADHRRVIAPVANYFYPESLEDLAANSLLKAVSTVRQMGYDMVKDLAAY